MTWTKWCWVHKGRLSQFLPLAWNCPVNELRGPLGLEGEDCWQYCSPREDTCWQFDIQADGLIPFFYSRCWRIPASNMEIILWVSKMKNSSEVFSWPAFWTVFAVDLVHTQTPSSQPCKSKFLFLLRDILVRENRKRPLPGRGPMRASCHDSLRNA